MLKAARALDVLGHHCSVSAAFVFGSQVAGQPRPDSDIDLAVFIQNAAETEQ
jgi:predicted nucleotidyltransferase